MTLMQCARLSHDRHRAGTTLSPMALRPPELALARGAVIRILLAGSGGSDPGHPAATLAIGPHLPR